jgi:hyaluronan synthase
LSERFLQLPALAPREPQVAPHISASLPGSWRSPLPAPRLWQGRGEDWLFCAAIVAGFALLIAANLHPFLLRPLWIAAEQHRWGRLLIRPSMLFLAMGALLLTFRTVLWFRYRPFPSCTFNAAPRLSVVIPAYNEGPMVMNSVASVAEAFYPRGRLEIFVVDDGSTDDTWACIRRAARRYPNLVTPIRLPRNRGKRGALAAGFARCHGDVILTLDSDSVVEPDALLAVAGPFRQPNVGAVAGKVTVFNRAQGIIPRMLHVQYTLSFDLMRAVESSYRTVYCCPGALTAYRATVLRSVLPRWMAQTFLGAPCTYGEDRALTNLVLSSGYDTVYQRSAQVRTIVPVRYRQLCGMFLRWDRSYVREEIEFLKIVWKRPPGVRIVALCERLLTNLRYPVNYAVMTLLAFVVATRPENVLRLLAAIGLVSLFNMIFYLRSERSPDFVYGIFYGYYAFFALFWIFPYALVTVRARSWMTR